MNLGNFQAYPLATVLKNIGKVSNDTCRFCEKQKETAYHILCDCEAIHNLKVVLNDVIWSADLDVRFIGRFNPMERILLTMRSYPAFSM